METFSEDQTTVATKKSKDKSKEKAKPNKRNRSPNSSMEMVAKTENKDMRMDDKDD